MRHAFAITCVALITAGLLSAGSGAPDGDVVNRNWLDRLDPVDRSCLEQGVGYAAPAFPEDASWIGSAPLTWEKLNGRVVVLQSQLEAALSRAPGLDA